MRNIVRELTPTLERLNICDTKLIEAIISSLEGDSEGVKNLACIIAPDMPKDSLTRMTAHMQETKNILNFDLFDKITTSINRNQIEQQNNKKNVKDLDRFTKKIEEGKVSTKDLFRLADEEGNGNGSISEKEFLVLTRRLGINLTEHRVAEIFAKVKLESRRQDNDDELNEKEFEQALEYIKEKNSLQALKLLKITPEILAAILIRLIVMLILIFIFPE